MNGSLKAATSEDSYGKKITTKLFESMMHLCPSGACLSNKSDES